MEQNIILYTAPVAVESVAEVPRAILERATFPSVGAGVTARGIPVI